MNELFQLQESEIQKLEDLLSNSVAVDVASLQAVNDMDCSQSPCKNTCQGHCDGESR